MKKISIITMALCSVVFLWIAKANAHFGGIIPSDDIISEKDNKNITVSIKFFHPMEGNYMNMEKPVHFGVMHMGEKVDLLKGLTEKKVKGFSTWETVYPVKRPGDYIFYVEPKPYWEPAEDKYILHYTKVCVNALGLEEGWDNEVGLEAEIVPLVRPYGLWTGNIFRGIVKVNGKPVPYAEIEVEYYNEKGDVKIPADPYITQVIKADSNGVFSYAMPKAGWWGFAALTEAERKMKGPDGKDKPIEIGAVIWVRTRDMK